MSLETSIDQLTAAINSIAGPRPRPILFTLGPFSEQTSPVTPTPEFQGPQQGEILGMATLKATQKCTLTVQFLDKKGNVASVDGTPEWITDHSDVVALVVAADGLSVEVSAVGPVGSAAVSVTADADLGDGVVAVVGSEGFSVVAGDATVVAIGVSQPTEQ